MSASALILGFAALLPALTDGPAVELRYTGTLTSAPRRGSSAQVKQFSLYCLYVRGKSDGSLAYVVEESGGGGWPWPERFGRIDVGKDLTLAKGAGIRLLHTHDGTKYPLTLRPPLFEYAGKLDDGAEWKGSGGAKYEVLRRRKVGGYDCRQVEVSSRRGHSQTVFVPLNSPLVVKSQQVVFMGRGERFRLEMELQSAKSIDAAALAKRQAPLKTLLALQSALKRRKGQTRPELSAGQLSLVRKTLRTLEKDAEGTPFHRLVAFIKADAESQGQREGDVATLVKKYLDKPAPKFALKGLDGKAVDPNERSGRIVVMHFWEYQGDRLEEPYGQVGYLDYLHSKRRRFGVKVYGVAVDGRLGQEGKAAEALRSIRKLKSFMNLGYPVTLDDGELLKKFGDPRRFDAKLPLWVVIDHTGKIRHYKAGFYNIRPDEGLKPLDDVVVRLIREQRNRR